MANDIVPALYERIKTDFNNAMRKDKEIREFDRKLKDNTAAAYDVSLYAANLGRCASIALVKNLTEENLPDGKLYWNIADRTIWPILEEVHNMVMNAAISVQESEDKKEDIHLKPIRSDFPKQRVHDLLAKLIEILEEDDDGGAVE